MTADRKKAVLFLSLTLILGILIGSMLPGAIGRMRYRSGTHERSSNRMDQGRHNRFTGMIIRVVKPDSDQIKLIRPITEATAARVQELEKISNEKMSQLMDSMRLQLQPILNPEQIKRLDDFDKKSKSRWHGHRDGGEREVKK
jgi:hypothetical protein